MSYRTILVHSDATDQATPRLRAAVDLAQRFGAHLVGVHVREPFVPPGPLDAPVAMDAFSAAYEKDTRADRQKSRALYDQAIKDKSVVAEWCSMEGSPERELGLRARYADLVVVSQADTAESSVGAGLPELVALATGRGVVVVPRGDPGRPIGRIVMLCWNGSREAARAAWGALPILKQAEKLIVLVVDPASTAGYGAQLGTDVAVWLGRHGIRATLERRAASHGDVGATILAQAAEHDVDLIVMGLYGHSRAREFVLGGASRTVLRATKLPLFIAH